ncbi:MAG: hypothetical protein ACYTF6_14325 [Planctomycetota bacterium]|jgi:hypothetical protein
MQETGVYWHMLPTATQARKVIWLGIDAKGRRIIDQAFPPEIRKRVNDNEMMIELVNGSIVQIVGSDNFDSLVGANPRGIIFSEYSIANPKAWTYLRPILRENGGFAIFIFTPRGHNHGHRLYLNACKSDNWYTELLTVEDTKREDGSPVISVEDVEEEIREGMDPDEAQQEFFCSFEGGLKGAYFTQEVSEIRKNRLIHVPNDPHARSITAWDLGIHDKTAIGVFQADPLSGRPILMDAYEDRNKGLEHYIRHVRNWPYTFNWHFAPHDVNKHEFTSGTRVIDRAYDMGICFEPLDKTGLNDGIDNLRAFLKVLTVNDNENTRHVLDMLQSYHREYDDHRQVFKDKPVHDFSSDTTDMMRYCAQAWQPGLCNAREARKVNVKRAIR